MDEFFIKHNGNIIISYDRTKISNRKVIFIISELALLLPLLFAFRENLVYLILLFPFLGVILFLILWSFVVDKNNKKKEELLAFKSLNDVIALDIKKLGINIKELDRKYIRIDLEKETKRAVYVILSNGEELKYNIVDKAEYNNKRVFEINVKYSIAKESSSSH